MWECSDYLWLIEAVEERLFERLLTVHTCLAVLRGSRSLINIQTFKLDMSRHFDSLVQWPPNEVTADKGASVLSGLYCAERLSNRGATVLIGYLRRPCVVRRSCRRRWCALSVRSGCVARGPGTSGRPGPEAGLLLPPGFSVESPGDVPAVWAPHTNRL